VDDGPAREGADPEQLLHGIVSPQPGLLEGSLGGHDDLAAVLSILEGDDIGGPILSQVFAVDLPDGLIVHDGDAEIAGLAFRADVDRPFDELKVDLQQGLQIVDFNRHSTRGLPPGGP